MLAMAGLVMTILLLYVLYLRHMWLYEERITRAQTAKMLALMEYDKAECEAADTVDIKDVPKESWYGKYVSAVVGKGYMSLSDSGEFYPAASLTYGAMEQIMDAFHISGENLSFSMDFVQKDALVPRRRWLEVFRLLCVQNSQVTVRSLMIVGTAANMSGLEDWQLLSDDGLKGYEGLAVDRYLYKNVTAWMRDDEILCVAGEESGEAALENVWIAGGKETLDIFTQGYTLSLNMGMELLEETDGQMGDVLFEDGVLKSIRVKPDHIRARLDQIGENTMTLEGYGEIPVAEDLVIYQIHPKPRVISREELKADGTLTCEFVLEAGTICGVIWQDRAQESIRVLLHDDSDTDHIHEYVALTCDEDYWVRSDTQVEKKQAGVEWSIWADDPRLSDGRVTVASGSGEGKIQMLSMERACGTPAYRGTIELSRAQDGIAVINEVRLEEYLYGVVPSEMPSDYGTEALKVQAVCARTYARAHLDDTFNGFDAHVDDTVSSQVYNNTLETEASIEAVSETSGQVLERDGSLVPVYFFSTSCGHTSDAADVWCEGAGDTSVSSGDGRFLSDAAIDLDLQEADDFKTFIDNEEAYGYFEQDMPWFRWQVTLKLDDIKACLTQEQTDQIGGLKAVSTGERAESGLLRSIVLEGDAGRMEIYGEYRIRSVLSPANRVVVLQDGDERSGMSLLPSGYFYMEPVYDGAGEVTGYFIRGGGYGHGTGMSQNGAWAMTAAGKTYEEVLSYFFPEAELVME